MAKKTKVSNLSIEERLEQALIPNWDEPYKLPENWCWVRADAIASIYTGNSINERVKEEKYTGRTDGLVYLATKDIDFNSTIDYDTNVCIPQSDGFKVAPKHSTLLCIEGGSAGRKIGFITQDVCFVNKLCAFVPHDKINPKYLYYAIQSDAFKKQFDAKKHGLIGGVSVKEVSSIFIPFAPVEIQNKIVELIESVFNKLDVASEKAQDVVDGFETRKAAILHKAFSGELTVKWREIEGLIFSKEQIALEELCYKITDGFHNSPKPVTNGYPYIMAGDVQESGINFDNGLYMDEKNHRELYKKAFPQKGDILMVNIGASTGRSAIIDVDFEFSFKNCAILKLKKEKVVPQYILYYLWSQKERLLKEVTQGGAQPFLSLKIIKNINIPIVEYSEQKEIVKLLEGLLLKEQQAKENAEAVIEQIDTMKKAILARAFRGELGTNDPSEESAVELLKRVLGGEVAVQAPAKKPTKRITIPSVIKELLSNIREEEIIKLLLKSDPQSVSIQEIMSISSKKFELMDALRSLEKKQLVTKNESGEYSLTR